MGAFVVTRIGSVSLHVRCVVHTDVGMGSQATPCLPPSQSGKVVHLQQGYSLSATAFRLGEATEIRGKHGGKRPPSGAARTRSSSNSHSNNSGTASKGANTALAAAQRRAGVNFSIGVASKEHSAARDAVVMPWEHKVHPTLFAACCMLPATRSTPHTQRGAGDVKHWHCRHWQRQARPGVPGGS